MVSARRDCDDDDDGKLCSSLCDVASCRRFIPEPCPGGFFFFLSNINTIQGRVVLQVYLYHNIFIYYIQHKIDCSYYYIYKIPTSPPFQLPLSIFYQLFFLFQLQEWYWCIVLLSDPPLSVEINRPLQNF